MTTSPLPGVRRYESSLGSKLWSATGGALLAAFAAFIVTKFGLAEIANVRSGALLIGAFALFVVLGFGLSLVRSFVSRPVRIDVTREAVDVFTGRTHKYTLPRSEYVFGSFVVQNATSSRASERRLIATGATRRLEIPCPGFSASQFGELLADVAPVEAPTSPARSPSADAWVFDLDPGGRVLGVAVVMAVFVVVLLAAAAGVIWLSLAQPTAVSESVDSAVVIAVIGMGVFVVPIVLLAVRLARVSCIPRRIELTATTLALGSRMFRLDQLTRVTVTPDSYRGSDKFLTLVNGDGTRVRLLLETGGSLVRRPVFAEYSAFSEELARRLPTGVMRFELG